MLLNDFSRKVSKVLRCLSIFIFFVHVFFFAKTTWICAFLQLGESSYPFLLTYT
jgi:hypothetical protein